MKIKVMFIFAIALSLSLSARAQKSVKDYLDELKSAGFPDVRAVSFAATKKGLAMTTLFKNEDRKTGINYLAETYPAKDELNIVFKAFVPCELTDDTKMLRERIIMISDQKVVAYYGCAKEPGGSETKEIYLIKSTEGRDFAIRQFSEKNYVFVNLNGLPIPFHTEGFSELIAKIGGKAL